MAVPFSANLTLAPPSTSAVTAGTSRIRKAEAGIDRGEAYLRKWRFRAEGTGLALMAGCIRLSIDEYAMVEVMGSSSCSRR